MASTQKILHIAGWNTCSFYNRACKVLSSLAILFPTQMKVIEHSFESRAAYRSWLIDSGFRTSVPDSRAHAHTSSPFVWTSSSVTDVPKVEDVNGFIGGHDDTIDFCRKYCTPSDDATSSDEDGVTMADDGYDASHEYDYDLIVIGGGSGGLAASKEAVNQGASKVAVLDFVKPSPSGTTWGLGGTCVNVGCIPKKLMHQAALIRETTMADGPAFGLKFMSELQPNKQLRGTTEEGDHSWETMRENVQNHIRGLNFKYRVNLRENNVTYLNKLGKFKDAHTVEVTDKKGKTTELTAARFLVAVGGRPTALDCEGGDLAISSDDVFALEKSPGKTLCVGASYISLECAGFLAGLGLDVTVAARSILLRGFDRECAEKIGEYMEEHGVTFRKQVVPTKLEKVDGDQILVTFSDNSSEVYDTVLVAIGRSADTSKLGLENVNVEANASNGKISTKNEQTTTPNIYAIGDVMEGCPELTPVAIQAGTSLARRMFGTSKEPMDYRNICTTVFTPIEYGTVGYSEEEAIEAFGKDKLEVYIKSFTPLEWSISSERGQSTAFTKVIVDSITDKVLGIHFLGPSAGEVMQGYGVAMKKGITFTDLKETVGIHPTSAEEIVTISVTKRSGEDASAAGC